MKNLYKTVLLLLLPLLGFSQNLIPNGSFESGISPWGGLGGCPIASYYFSAGNNCSNQYDYLAEVDPVTCSLPQFTLDLGVPENHFGYIQASNANSDSVKTKRPFELYLSKGFGYYFVVGDGYIEPDLSKQGFESFTNDAFYKQTFSYGNFFIMFRTSLSKNFYLTTGLGYTNRRIRLLANENTIDFYRSVNYSFPDISFHRDINYYLAELPILIDYNLPKNFMVSIGSKFVLPFYFFYSNNKLYANEDGIMVFTKPYTLSSLFFLPDKNSLVNFFNTSSHFTFYPNIMIGKKISIKNEKFMIQAFYEHENRLGFNFSYFIK